MGCGQSQIGIIYPRKSKNKDGTKKNGEGGESEEEDKDGEAEDSEEAGLRARTCQVIQTPPGPLLAHAELSSSQNDFFKMLDQKIESGPDYDSTNEYEIAMEHARLCRLLQDWEMAKIRSLSRMTSGTPTRKPLRYMQANGNVPLYRHRYPLSNSVVMYDKRGGYYTELA